MPERPKLGAGIYSFAEASWILGVSHRKMQAWFGGWPRGSGPVLSSDYAREAQAISFLDLTDTLVVSRLRSCNVSTHAIRRAYEQLAESWGAHPFSRQDLLTDETGTTVFLSAATDCDDEILVDLIRRQHAFPEILKRYLKPVSYDPISGFAGKVTLDEAGVVIDPDRHFGKPIIDESGFPVLILKRAFDANDRDEQAVAEWHGVTPEQVLIAARFYDRYQGLAEAA